MSQKSKINRARRDAKQEEEGKNVVKWIFISLIVLARAAKRQCLSWAW